MQKERMLKEHMQMLRDGLLMQRDTGTRRAEEERMQKATTAKLSATIRMQKTMEQRQSATALMLPDISLRLKAGSRMSGTARPGRTMAEAVCCQAMEYTP
jgi:hypothetical protein